MTAFRRFGGLLAIAACLATASGAIAQNAEDAAIRAAVEATTAEPAAAPAGAPPGAVRVQIGPDGKPMAVPPGQNPGGKAGEGGKPADGAKPEDKPKTTTRPTKPDAAADPKELEIRPDENGRVRFNFHGQPWPAVLEWLARVSDLSLDWQEVPADYLNLRTQRSYTIPEARDLINRHLLDRGFTLIRHGEVLSVVNIKKIDPSAVPRVAPDALDEREPHEFVKVSFPLDSLTAEAATEELKPMVSPNGKLSALKATNRVEVMDAAINLIEIRDMLANEQSHRGRKRIVREFRLEYTRAAEVIEQVRELLGLEKKKSTQGGGQMSREQMMMQQQQMMMEQQQAQQGGPKPPPKQTPQVHLVANPRENSIVVQAPADQMAIVAEAVKLIDVPSSRSQDLRQSVNRTQVYRLAAVDPEVLVKMLEDMGDLDPTTRLQVDKRNKSIIAHAALADHLTIRTLVNKLDGTDRKFEVIKLRRLEADYVAGTIEFMMGGGEKKKQQNNRYYPYFDYYPYGGGRGNEQEDESRKFRVDADTEHNRLLLWANAIELDEVSHLLVKLGEISGPGGNLSTLRVLDTIPPEEVDQLLKKLRRSWQGVGKNPLEIAPKPEPEEDEPAVRPSNQKKQPPRKRDGETTTQAPPPKSNLPVVTEARLFRLIDEDESSKDATEAESVEAPAPRARAAEKPAGDGKDADDEGAVEELPPSGPTREARAARTAAPAAPPAPIRIGRGPDGKMIISSSDTEALDRLEDLVAEMSPGRRDYKIFKLKYHTTWAYGVALNLKDFFEEKEKKPSRSRYDYIYFGYSPSSGGQSDDDRRLSKRRPLKFISDADSNSILVTGADQNQLRIIEELIDLYDVPESKDSAAVRQTKLVHVKYSKARALADAVKEVYRDLLSANDPALQNQNGQNKKGNDSMYTYINNFGNDEKKPDSPAKFKGQLSIGVVELSNTLVVSAGEGLADSVVATIEALDQAAIPSLSRMRVMKVDRTIDANELQKRLKNLVTKPPQPKPQQHPQQQNQQQMPNPESATFIDNN
ncbi:MAG: hypothetical protein HY290_11785 [Planctomycetia bacterium]|nr:hypothetical protein [Planctomycetia bacterium]